jgi:dienelactone hydrolase
MRSPATPSPDRHLRHVAIPPVHGGGVLRLPGPGAGIVVFAHGSGSSHLSPRNNYVAEKLFDVGLRSLLFDLLTEDEARDRRNVFDIPLLAGRLKAAIDWLEAEPDTVSHAVGLFGASTGAAACLLAEGGRPGVRAIVSRGGRPDLAEAVLAGVKAPTLLIVGGNDPEVLALNRKALAAMHCTKALKVVPGATHLFEEPGTLDAVVSHAGRWFLRYFREVPD